MIAFFDKDKTHLIKNESKKENIHFKEFTSFCLIFSLVEKSIIFQRSVFSTKKVNFTRQVSAQNLRFDFKYLFNSKFQSLNI